MLPPSDAQQLRQAPQTQDLGYSSVDKSLTACLCGPQVREPSLSSLVAPTSLDFYVWMEARIRRIEICNTAVYETKPIMPELMFVHWSGFKLPTLPGHWSQWALLEVTGNCIFSLFASLVGNLPWKLPGFCEFQPLFIQFLCHTMVSLSNLLGMSKVLLSLFGLASCLSVLSLKAT